MKLSGKMITTGGAIALLAASGLLDQKTPPTVANDNKAKIAAILGSSTRAGTRRLSDAIDNTKRIFKSDDPMHRGAYEDNIKHAISPSDNTGFMAWDEAGGRIELRIRFGGINNSDIKDVEISHFKETSSSHPEQTTFSDKDGDGVFDICDVKDGETVSTHPCSLEDQERIGSLLEIIKKRYN